MEANYKMINFDKLTSKAVKELTLYSTLIFVALVFLVEIVTRNEPYFSFYLTIMFAFVALASSYSIMSFTKRFTQERAFAFSLIGGGLFVFLALFLPTSFNLFQNISFPIFKVGIENLIPHTLILLTIAAVSYLGAMKLRRMI